MLKIDRKVKLGAAFIKELKKTPTHMPPAAT